jgi:Leucine-rich repeat (LRR) protein
LAWSNVTRLSAKLFRGLSSLRNLSLAENRLRRLPHQLFDDLISVERLSLAGNSDLNELPGDAFRNQGSSLQVFYSSFVFNWKKTLSFLSFQG